MVSQAVPTPTTSQATDTDRLRSGPDQGHVAAIDRQPLPEQLRRGGETAEPDRRKARQGRSTGTTSLFEVLRDRERSITYFL